MNNITIAGSLGKDAETKFLPDGTPLLKFSVADSQGRDKPTTWWDCSLFGKRAESLAQYMTKGQSVTVSGTVGMREYEKDGVKLKAYDIRVNDVALQGGAKQQGAAPAPAGNGRGRDGYDFPEPAKAGSGGGNFDDDIPFAPIPRAALMSI